MYFITTGNLLKVNFYLSSNIYRQVMSASEVPYPTLAIGFASGVVAFVALICAMIYNAHMHVKKVEEGYRKMEELKVQAEAADIAKSQVYFYRLKMNVTIEFIMSF